MSVRVLIRADGSSAIGSGHVMRCAALAEELRERGAEVEFACRDLAGAPLAAVERERGFRVRRLPAAARDWQDDFESAIGQRASTDWVVVDHYGLGADWESAAKRLGARVLAIDDAACRRHECDVLVDQNFHESACRYAAWLPAGCRTLLGPRFALLRKEFRQARPKVRDGQLRRAWIFYGSTDETGETLKALEAIRTAGVPRLAVDVLVGGNNPRAADIGRLAATLPAVTIHAAGTPMAALMGKADVAFGAGGVSMWERCAVGLPTIVTAIAENQVGPSEATGTAGLSLYPGTSRQAGVAQLAEALRSLAASPERLRQLSAAVRELVDGQGARRVADVMLEVAVGLRAAQEADCDLVHAWRNHPAVRSVSHDRRVIDLASHRTWYRAALADPSRILLMIELAGQPVGVLRYDIRDAVAAVSVYLDPRRMGQGIGAAALRAGSRWIHARRPEVTTLVAEIADGNARSAGAFVKAGYLARSNNIYEETLSHAG